jgi:hypothetical protein
MVNILLLFFINKLISKANLKQQINPKVNNLIFEHKNTDLYNYNEYYTITDFYFKQNNSYNSNQITLNPNYNILGMKNQNKFVKLRSLFENIFSNHLKKCIIEQKYKYIVNKYKFYSLVIFTLLAFLIVFIKQHTTGCCLSQGL